MISNMMQKILHMIFRETKKPPLLTSQDEYIITSIMREEHLSITSELIRDAILHKYGSISPIHAGQIALLYNPDVNNWDLRHTACAVAESYCTDHKHPEIDNLVNFVAWAEKHLEGIPFMKEHDPHKTGDYDPTRPAVWLESLYNHLERYTREAEYIDELHYLHPDRYKNILPGNGGESNIVTNHNEYNAAKGGWYHNQAQAIEAAINSPDFTPSKGLSILREYWTYYVTPSVFRAIGAPIAYCLYCAAEFPDTPESRKEFRRAVYAIHDDPPPQKK